MEELPGLADHVLAGELRAVARALSLVESDGPSGAGAGELLRLLMRGTGRAHVVGVTGPPGSGKSTLTDKMVRELRSRGRTVGVVAVDPSSPFTGGAILGDRIRMQSHAGDDGVFIRSFASRGHLGGLSRACGDAVRVLDAAGYNDVIIETVGVGQSEVDIVRLADTVVLVAVPGLGDDIQAIKAGVMEIGDVFVVNKADRDGADRVVREIRSMLETAVLNGAATRFSELYGDPHSPTLPTGSGHHAQGGPRGEFAPPVLLATAETGKGVKELVDEVKAHEAALVATGLLGRRRRERTAWEIRDGVASRVLARLEGEGARLAELALEVEGKHRDVRGAVDALLAALGRA